MKKKTVKKYQSKGQVTTTPPTKKEIRKMTAGDVPYKTAAEADSAIAAQKAKIDSMATKPGTRVTIKTGMKKGGTTKSKAKKK